MWYKKPLLFFVLLFISLNAFSTVFTVTSNADSGPGTLRDALTQAAAADSSVTNYIYFNLPDVSQAGRTITLFSQLPDVSSNLVIDGSTQPGAKFGVSDAHVALFVQAPVEQTISVLYVANKHDVAIYGLYIKFLTDVTKSNLLYFWTGIGLRNDINVTVGAAGKGNVINGFLNSLIVNQPVNEFEYFENLTLKDNIFGLDADGETQSINQVGSVSLSFIIGNITIGGTAAEGNLFADGVAIGQDNSYDSTDPSDYYVSNPAFIKIQNNKIGVDYLVQNEIAASTGLYLTTVDPDGKNNCTIADNVIVAPQNTAIFIGNNGRPLYMLRNYIGTDKTLTKSFKTGGIFIYGASQAAIGSINTADANYITNCNPVSIWPFSNVTVNKNSFYCTIDAQPMHGGNNNSDFEFPFPVINILNISANSVTGSATPNSSIELFYSDKCGTCSPQTYFASTTADANGNWQYNGNVTGTVIASATLGLNTSDFTQTSINTDNVTIINACGNGFGSIKGAVPQSAQNLKWEDSTGKLVGTNPDLLNVKIGKYKLVASNGSCADSTSYYQIQNKFLLDTSAIKRTEPSCGNKTGSITGLNIIDNDPGAPYLIWQDINGKPLAYTMDLPNVSAGSYYLQIKSADSTCSQIYGPFDLKNVSGPNIDQSNAIKQSTNCGQSTGSITGITATGTGTLKYTWLNSQQQTVGTSLDLLNQPTGAYKLEVTDDSQCGPVYTTDLTIPETNGITMDESKAQPAVASCNNNNGSVTGIAVSGATQYQWLDANNKVVGTAADLQNVAPGTYTLTASNSFGCAATSKPYNVGQLPPTKFPVYAATSVPACFQSTDGSVTVAIDALVKSVRWVNASGQDAGANAALTNVAAGTYQLYLTDQNGCENYYNTYTVDQLPQFAVTDNGATVNDECTLGTGSISGVTIAGGAPPYAYTWYDASNMVIGTGTSISNLSAGVYTLSVTDTRCGNAKITYTLTDESEEVPAPSVSNVALCSSGNAIITVNNPSSSTVYRLYDNQTDTQSLAEQKGGRFVVSVSGNTSFYISQLNGSCESSRAEVKVTVGLSALNIANTFTPNGDGINDFWMINGITNYPAAEVQVFTRNGQRIFDSKGYATPFDGTFDGKKLPEGVYYYIIDLHSNCSLLSGSLTIIR